MRILRSRNNRGSSSLDVWILRIFIFFGFLILTFAILDGIFLYLIKSSLDGLAQNFASYAATIGVDSDNVDGLAALTRERCTAAADDFEDKEIVYMGFPERVRDNFIQAANNPVFVRVNNLPQNNDGILQVLEDAGAITNPEFLRRGDETTNTDGPGGGCFGIYEESSNQLLIFVVIHSNHIWPVFLGGLSFDTEEVLPDDPRTWLRGIGNATAAGVAESDDLEVNELGKSLISLGVRPTLTSAGVGPSVDNDFLIVGGLDESQASNAIDRNNQFNKIIQITNTTDIPNAPLILVGIRYAWYISKDGCGISPGGLQFAGARGIPLDRDLWNVDPNEYIIVTHNENRSGNLPIGIQQTGANPFRYRADLVDLDGNNGPLIIRGDNAQIACNVDPDTTHQDAGGMIDARRIDMIRPPVYRAGVEYLVGPYNLPDGQNVTEARNNIVSVQEQDPIFRNNLIYKLTPYYQHCPICPRGTPHCGFFGHCNAPGGDFGWTTASSSLVFQARLWSNTQYVRENGKRLELRCRYRLHCQEGHCCDDTDDQWCQDNMVGTREVGCSCSKQVEEWVDPGDKEKGKHWVTHTQNFKDAWQITSTAKGGAPDCSANLTCCNSQVSAQTWHGCTNAFNDSQWNNGCSYHSTPLSVGQFIQAIPNQAHNNACSGSPPTADTCNPPG